MLPLSLALSLRNRPRNARLTRQGSDRTKMARNSRGGRRRSGSPEARRGPAAPAAARSKAAAAAAKAAAATKAATASSGAAKSDWRRKAAEIAGETAGLG